MRKWHYNTIVIIPVGQSHWLRKRPTDVDHVYISWVAPWGITEQFVPTIGLDGVSPLNLRD